MQDGFDFEVQWPRIRQELHILLARRQVPPWLQEDLVQETGARLWSMRDAIDPDRPLAMANAIVANLLKDQLRKKRHVALEDRFTEVPASQDVVREVEVRDDWHRFRLAFARLSPRYRAILVAGMETDRIPGVRTPDAVRMMRTRARKQLRVLMEETARGGAGCVVNVVRAWEALRLQSIRSSSQVGQWLVQVATAAAVALAVVGSSPAMDPVQPPPENGPAAWHGGAIVRAQLAVAVSSSQGWDQGAIPVGSISRTVRDPSKEKHAVLLSVGPVTYSSGRSVTSGTLTVDPEGWATTAADLQRVAKGLCRPLRLGSCDASDGVTRRRILN